MAEDTQIGVTPRPRRPPRPPSPGNGASAGTPGAPRPPLRYRVLPRSLLGITSLLLAFAVGAGFSGALLFSYYQYRLDQTNSRVNALINGYTKQFHNAESQLKSQTATDRNQIQGQLAPLQQLEAQSGTLAALLKHAGPSLFFVHTLDQAGAPSVGSAFVVASNPSQSLLLTSYTTVAAATRSPGPQVYVQQGTTSTPVTVRTWDPANDLALLVLARGGLHALPAAPARPAPSIGERVFALSGLGGSVGAISQGAVTGVSANAIEHNVPIGSAYQGGPLLDSSGHVVGVASLRFAPLGFTSSGVWFAPYENAACNRVLSCPNGTVAGASAR